MSAASRGGLSKAGLRRMHDALSRHVERGEVPGLVTAIRRRGETHVDAIGAMAAGGARPMQRGTIFRIASMTKAATAVAALILAEECRLRLGEPVDRLLPELANRRVLRRPDGPLDDTVPAERPITVLDLLTFRMGSGLAAGPAGAHPIQAALREQGIMTALPNPPSPHPPDEWMRRLGSLPLVHQPGERWMYHLGSDVLGVLIARASRQPFDVFLRERIFDPLGMKATGFSLPADRLDLLAPCYRLPAGGTLEAYDDGNDWSIAPAFPSGGGGLLSTVDDYLAFGQMLLDKGRLGRTRILSRPSVELMTTDHLTGAQKAASPLLPGFWDAHGWGFGVAIVTRRDGIADVPGRFGWDGGFGTSWSCDPSESMVALMLMQRLGLPMATGINRDFWTGAYQSIDD